MSPKRREFLKAAGASSIAGLAGCTGQTENRDETATDTTDIDGTTEAHTSKRETTTTGTEPDDEETPTETEPEPEDQAVIELKAGGTDIWNATDLGHFYYEELSGDFDVRVEAMSLEETSSWAKAGLMVRASLDPASQYVFAMRRPDGETTTQFRPAAGESAKGVYYNGDPLGTLELDEKPDRTWHWQRLEREGDTVRTYVSPDGEHWTLQTEFTDEVQFPETVRVGLAATSHNESEATTALFKGLDGIAPQHDIDLGDPTVEGDVRTTHPSVISLADPDISRSSLTLTADVHLGNNDSTEVRFKYRRVPDSRWTDLGTITVEENGGVEYEVTGLESRRLVQYQAFVDDGDTEFGTAVRFVSTAAPTDGDSDAEGPASAAPHDFADGFVDPAPWLDDSTPIVTITEPDADQFRRAVSADHPRVIVFETSGAVDLDGGELHISRDECWIAGQTAPSPGITLIRGDVHVEANDSVVQHLRSRPGDAGKTGTWQNGAFDVAPGTDNVVLDHLTATWSIDENLSIGYPGTGQVTVSNCLIAEALHNSLHPKGRHGYGSIASPQGSEETAHLGNIWALNSARNPRSGPKGFYGNCMTFYFERAAHLDRDAKNAFIGHLFTGSVDGTNGCIRDGYVYTEDCLTEPEELPLTNIQGALNEPPLMPAGFEAIPGTETEAAALEHVGARPADRTAIDERIVGMIGDRRGHYIDSQTEVGGYPDLAENTRELEIPDSGLRTWLREQALVVEP